LVIATSHDWTLEPLIFAAKLKEAGVVTNDEKVIEMYINPGKRRNCSNQEPLLVGLSI
jgi:hypothetical protein